MDTKRLMHLAGLPAKETDVLYEQLNEVVQLPENITIEDLALRLDHCKKALSLASKLQGADRKKWISACFVNLNKVRGALQTMISKMDAETPAPIKTSAAPTSVAPVAGPGAVDGQTLQ